MDSRDCDSKSAGEVLMQYMRNEIEEDPPEYDVNTSTTFQDQATSIPEILPNVKTFHDITHMSDFSYKYNMNHEYRGCFIIFNHMHYAKDLPSREGTEVDCKNLEVTAKSLGFEYVRIFHDLTKGEIKQLIKQIAEADHSDYDCLAIAVLTHGEPDDYLYARDARYHIDSITKPFFASSCKTLAGKPKLFFIQACRGRNMIPGYELKPSRNEDCVDSAPIAPTTEKLVIPNSADYLLAHSTMPGYFAWRNSKWGSCFINALCKCLDEYGTSLELMHILTRVNRIVAYTFESNTGDPITEKKKQIPSIVTRLTREVYFPPKRKDLHKHN